MAAGLRARTVERRLGPVALWAALPATPLVFDVALVVVVGPAATAIAIATWGALRAAGSRRPAWLELAAASIAVAVLLRSEAVLAARALAAALAVAGPRSGPRPSTRWLAAGVVAGAGAASYLFDRAWMSSITGTATEPFTAISQGHGLLEARLGAGWALLLHPGIGDGGLRAFLVLVAMVALPAAALLARGAAPGASPRLRGRRAGAVALLAALTAVGVVVTSYAEVGGSEWGARYLHLILPLLGVCILVGLEP